MITSGNHEVMVGTVDDWYPNFEKCLVRVSLLQLYPSTDWRVCVWGADDCGMERDFSNREMAQHVYVAIINRPYISKSDLLMNHFSYS